MSKISIDKLVPGMIIAKPVLNENGMILINEGTELTDTLIERLKTLRVEWINIKGASKPSIPKEEMLATLEKKFKMVENEPYMGQLKRLIKEHIESLYE